MTRRGSQSWDEDDLYDSIRNGDYAAIGSRGGPTPARRPVLRFSCSYGAMSLPAIHSYCEADARAIAALRMGCSVDDAALVVKQVAP